MQCVGRCGPIMQDGEYWVWGLEACKCWLKKECRWVALGDLPDPRSRLVATAPRVA
jgi:hypothetical protein